MGITRCRLMSLVLAAGTVAAAGCDSRLRSSQDAPADTTTVRTSTPGVSVPAPAKPPAASSVPNGSPGEPSTSPATTQSASARADDPNDDARLYGTWVAKDVGSSVGDVKVELKFHREGPVRILAWSELPFVGEVRDKKASYEVHGNTIHSDALRGGTSVQYHLDGGDLVIEYKDGKTVRFHRKT